VSVLPGNGGSFQPPRGYAAGPNPLFVAVGDFNGDGTPDLAVVVSSGVSVALGNGDGTFRPAGTYVAGVGPSAVAVADLNGDGFPDLAVVNGSSNDVSVLRNGTDWYLRVKDRQ
jgi:hypothetical protein